MMKTLLTLAVPAFLALAGPASAQQFDAAARQVRLQHRGCVIHDLREVYRGPIEGMAQPIVVVSYVFDSCDGSPAWRGTFSVFHEDRTGTLVALRIAPEARLVARNANLENGQLRMSGLEYARSDLRCCPSIRRTATYVVRGNQFTLVR